MLPEERTFITDNRRDAPYARSAGGLPVGHIVFSAGKIRRALLSFEHSLALDPENTGAWIGKGLALAYLGHYDVCIQAFDRALARDENDEITWYNRGLALHLLQHDEEALLSFDHILASNPEHLLAWEGKARSYAALEQYDKAIDAYDRALWYGPEDANEWTGKANALFDSTVTRTHCRLLREPLPLSPHMSMR